MKTPNSATQKALMWCAAAMAGLQFTASAATLNNRYSFNDAVGSTNIVDSVSGQNGYYFQTNSPGTGFGSLANFDTSGNYTNGNFIVLPPNLLTQYTAVTMELWIVPTALSDSTLWARMWDFGSSLNGAGVVSFIYAREGGTAITPFSDSFIATNGGDNYVFTTTPLNQAENHYVWTADANTHIAKVYLNGQLVGELDSFNNAPALAGSTTNDWLGRSQFSADPLINADYDEFRIYNGSLNALEIAADYQNGPDTYPASYGTVSSINLVVSPSQIALNAQVTAAVLADATGLTNTSVDIHDASGVTYTVGNTNVVTVNPYGVISAVGVGSTTVAAHYLSLSSTQAVTVFSVPTQMQHRYSFSNTTADNGGGPVIHDSVGTWTGYFNNTSGQSGFSGDGRLLLAGIVGDYVDLGPGIIDKTNITAGAVTFETWATVYPVNGAWTRLWDFGNTNAGNGANYFFFAPNTATGTNNATGGNSRIAVSEASPGFAGEDGFDVGNFLGSTNVHIVGVFNPNPSRNFLGLYVNGQFVQSTTVRKPQAGFDIPYSALVNNLSWIGKSTYSGDNPLAGEINEFRIYNGELNRFQVAASDQAGPDHTNFSLGTFTSLAVTPSAQPIPYSGYGTFTAVMNFTLVTNVSVIGDANLVVTSANTNVVVATRGGALRAVNPGSTTITAVYTYVDNTNSTSYTNTFAVSVARTEAGPTLIHRYSFNDGTANDSVGTANGTLNGGASISGGKVTLVNAAGAATDYVQLPAGVVTNQQAVSIEAWVSCGPLNANGWANIFDFGTQSAGLDAYSISLCAHTGTGITGDLNIAISDSDNANVHRQGADAGANSGLDNRNVHVVAVFDPPSHYLSVWTNGVLATFNSAVTIQMSGVQDVRNIIGADNWPDAGLVGSYDEFRIYSGVMHADEIQATDFLGPDALLNESTPVKMTATAGAGGGTTFSWPVAAAGQTLQSTSSLSGGGWTNVGGIAPAIVNGQWTVTVPASAGAQFFRLAH